MREDQYDFGAYIREEGFLAGRERADGLVERCTQCILELGPRNPRSVKRAFNLMNLYRRIQAQDVVPMEETADGREAGDLYLFAILLMQISREHLLSWLADTVVSGRPLAKIIAGTVSYDLDPTLRDDLDALRRALGGVFAELAEGVEDGTWIFPAGTTDGFIRALQRFMNVADTAAEKEIDELLRGKGLEPERRTSVRGAHLWQVDYLEAAENGGAPIKRFLMTKYRDSQKVQVTVFKTSSIDVPPSLRGIMRGTLSGPHVSATFVGVNGLGPVAFEDFKDLLRRIADG